MPFFQVIISKLKRIISKINPNFIILFISFLVLLVIVKDISQSYISSLKKSDYKKEKEQLQNQINSLNFKIADLENKYNSIDVTPEKETIVKIKTKYEKDTIYINLSPVSFADSIIRAEINSRK